MTIAIIVVDTKVVRALNGIVQVRITGREALTVKDVTTEKVTIIAAVTEADNQVMTGTIQAMEIARIVGVTMVRLPVVALVSANQ